MATTTTNFGWDIPQSTDLVKDGATAIAALGQDIDTALVDLKGGTTGQILAKASNTDLDYSWITNDVGDITAVTAGTGISGGGTTGAVTVTNSMATAIDAKGDLIGGTGADTFARLAVGANGTVLTADSAEATGLKWGAAASGALIKITSGTFSNQSSVVLDSVFTSTYKNYVARINIYAATGTDDFQFQFRTGGSTPTTNYYGSSFAYNRANTLANAGFSNTSVCTIADGIGDSTGISSYVFNFSQVGISSATPAYYGNGINNGSSQQAVVFAGSRVSDAATYDGFVLKSSSTNITGNYAIYGLVD
jgi:hypothetical protein